jgi:homoserine kinase type II
MSVFTTIDRDALAGFLSGYGLGGLVHYEGIADGVENSNFRIETARGRYVLTLLERFELSDLPYVLGLLEHLYARGIPCPRPLPDGRGGLHGVLADRTAVLTEYLPGAHVDAPDRSHCEAVGAALARLHVAGADFAARRTNPRGPRWWRRAAEQLQDRLTYDSLRVLDEELAFLARFDLARLPHGVIHADLFRDNVLFEHDTVSGLLDFYYACDDLYLFDLAITVNDWCSEPDGELDRYRMRALIRAYDAIRPLEQDEHAALPVMLRAAALRFWLSRMLDVHSPREGTLTAAKDPDQSLRILLARRQKLSGIQGI